MQGEGCCGALQSQAGRAGQHMRHHLPLLLKDSLTPQFVNFLQWQPKQSDLEKKKKVSFP